MNEAVRFLLELAALAILGVWGWRVGSTAPSKVALAVAAPLVTAIVWGRWVAPRASRRVDDPLRVVIELLVFGAGAAALLSMGRTGLGAIWSAVVATNLALMFLRSQR